MCSLLYIAVSCAAVGAATTLDAAGPTASNASAILPARGLVRPPAPTTPNKQAAVAGKLPVVVVVATVGVPLLIVKEPELKLVALSLICPKSTSGRVPVIVKGVDGIPLLMVVHVPRNA